MSRKVIYIVGGVIVVLLLVVVLLPFMVDANRFRPQIESAADSALNRKVTIGNIRLSILSGSLGGRPFYFGRSCLRPGPVSNSEVRDGCRRTRAADFLARTARDGADDQRAGGDLAADGGRGVEFFDLGRAGDAREAGTGEHDRFQGRDCSCACGCLGTAVEHRQRQDHGRESGRPGEDTRVRQPEPRCVRSLLHNSIPIPIHGEHSRKRQS